MRGQKTFVVLALLVLVAAACGTALTDEQALEELRAERGLDGSPGAASGATDLEDDVTGDDLEPARGVSDDASGVDATAGAPGAADDDAGTGGGEGGPEAGGGPEGDGQGSGAHVSRGGATDVGVTETDIRLGWVGTLTGPVPGLFRGALVGSQAFVNYQNSQGGLMGRRLSVLSADDALDSGRNRAAHLQLKDQVFAFVGSFSINDDGGAAVINDCQCPDITGNLSSQMHDSPYHYGPQPAAPGWRSGPPRYYAQKYGKDVIENLAFFVGQNAVAQEIAREQRRVYEAAGFKIVYSRSIPPNDNNQTADVVQMRQAGVRAIAYQGGDLDGIAKLANAMHQQSFSVELFNLGNSLYDSNTFTASSFEALEGVEIDQVYAMFLGEDADRVPELRLFNEWMQRTDPNQSVDLFALYGWMSGRLFADAMTKMAEEGKNPVRADLIETLRGWGEWDGNGLAAPVQIGRKQPSDCFFIFTVTPDDGFARTFPSGRQNYACDQGPFSPRP